MSKTRRNKKNYLRKITNTGKKAIPIVKTGLKRVGRTAKVVAVKSIPVVEKGVSKIYGAILKGFDLGVKGVRGISKKMPRTSRKSKKNHHYR